MSVRQTSLSSRLAGLVLMAVVSLAACSSGGASPTAPPQAPAATVVPTLAALATPTPATATLAPQPACASPCTVVMVNRAYHPKFIDIKVGTEVVWTNQACEGGCTVTFEPDVGIDSGPMPIGTTFKHTFSAAGSYRFHCKLDVNTMFGILTVTN